MGSVCGKYARNRGKYEVARGGSSLPDAKPDTACSACKKAKQLPIEHASDSPDAEHTATTKQQIKACPASAVQPKQKLDPKDFMFMKLQQQTRVKLPGSVNGQQFIIDTCEGCDLYVMDTCAMVTVDDCKDCRIFIGPTESSVFLRNCTNCKVACITRQLRTRDCQACDILLHTRTRPIIESSSSIAIGCYNTPYAGLAQQLAAANLNPFHNFWSDVFDFTPPAAAGSRQEQQQQRNWKLLPHGTDLVDLMGRVPEEVQMLLQYVKDTTEASSPAGAGVNVQSPSVAGEIALAEFLRSTASTPAVDLLAAERADSDPSEAVSTTAATAAAAIPVDGGRKADEAQHVLAEDDIGFTIVPSSCSACQDGQQSIAEDAEPASNNLSSTAEQLDQQPAVAPAANLPDAAARVALSVADVESVIVTAGELIDVQQLPEDCYAFMLFLPGNREAVLHWVAQQFPCSTAAAAGAAAAAGEATSSTDANLLRTNEAVIPVEVLKQMKKAAQYSQEQYKQLNAAAQQQHLCVGLEAKCCSAEQQQQLCAAAETVGAVCCKSLQAAKLFRCLGTDG